MQLGKTLHLGIMSVQPFHRPHVERLLELISSNPGKRIIAMTGPRQIGKTTIAIQAHQKLTRLGFSCWYTPLDDPNSVMMMEFEALRESTSDLPPYLLGIQRLDWRSSNTKRLMPRLQVTEPGHGG